MGLWPDPESQVHWTHFWIEFHLLITDLSFEITYIRHGTSWSLNTMSSCPVSTCNGCVQVLKFKTFQNYWNTIILVFNWSYISQYPLSKETTNKCISSSISINYLRFLQGFYRIWLNFSMLNGDNIPLTYELIKLISRAMIDKLMQYLAEKNSRSTLG